MCFGFFGLRDLLPECLDPLARFGGDEHLRIPFYNVHCLTCEGERQDQSAVQDGQRLVLVEHLAHSLLAALEFIECFVQVGCVAGDGHESIT